MLKKSAPGKLPGDDGDQYLSIGGLCRYVEQRYGQRPHPSTVLRWMTRGRGNARLRHVVAVRRRMSRPSWVDSFFEESAVELASPDPCDQSSTDRIRQAERELARSGI